MWSYESLGPWQQYCNGYAKIVSQTSASVYYETALTTLFLIPSKVGVSVIKNIACSKCRITLTYPVYVTSCYSIFSNPTILHHFKITVSKLTMSQICQSRVTSRKNMLRLACSTRQVKCKISWQSWLREEMAGKKLQYNLSNWNHSSHM